MSDIDTFGNTPIPPPSDQLDEVTDLLVKSGHGVGKDPMDLRAYSISGGRDSSEDPDDVLEGWRQAADELSGRSRKDDDERQAPRSDGDPEPPQYRPPALNTPEAVSQARAWLSSLSSQLDQDLIAGRIDPETHARMYELGNGAWLETQQAEINLHHQHQAMQQVERDYHDRIASQVAGWDKPKTRQRIINDLRQFGRERGISEQALYGHVAPDDVIAAYRMMSENKALKEKQSRHLAKVNAERREKARIKRTLDSSNGNPVKSVAAQTDAVANLLAGF